MEGYQQLNPKDTRSKQEIQNGTIHFFWNNCISNLSVFQKENSVVTLSKFPAVPGAHQALRSNKSSPAPKIPGLYSRTVKNNRTTWRPFERWSLFSSGSTSDDECCHSSLERQLQSQWHVYLAWCPVDLSSHPCCVSVHRKGKTMLWVMAMLWSWSHRPVLLH